jgi:ABC-type nitrate/sulfonate/bicarbonate transport system substrate-binding protein
MKETMQTTKKIAFALAAAGTLLLSACEEKTDAADIRFVLDWTPNTNHTGVYVAQDKGWFTEAGLNVKILMPPEDGALVLLGSGRAEFAVDFQETMGPAIAKKDGALPVQAVAAIISHNTSGLMSLATTGIKRPHDLEGKRFAFWETPFYEAVIRDIVEHDGGDFSKVSMIPNYASDAFSALETDIDSIWIYYGWDGIAAELRGTEIDYLDLGTINPVLDFYTPVIVTNTEWARANPETARKFLEAAGRGYRFATDNPEEAADILSRLVPELDSSMVKASQKYLAGRYQSDAPRWGWIDPERWSGFYRWMFERGLLETDIGEGGYTNEYLPR